MYTNSKLYQMLLLFVVVTSCQTSPIINQINPVNKSQPELLTALPSKETISKKGNHYKDTQTTKTILLPSLIKPQTSLEIPAQTKSFERIPISQLKVPSDFDYKTTKEIEVSITVINPNDQPYKNVFVKIHSIDQDPGKSSEFLTKGITNNEGVFIDTISLPSHYKDVFIQLSAIGIRNNSKLSINNGRIEHVFGIE